MKRKDFVKESKKNNEITLQEMKDCELSILEYIDSICRGNNLRYYLAYGTLIGAIRHKGFIPWDDDIDIAMPRRDFIKLLQFVKDSDRYKLVSSYNTKEYAVPFAKIYDKRTRLIQNYSFIEKTDIGVYVDIFILDGFPISSSETKKYAKDFESMLKKWYWANTKFRVSNSLLHDMLRFVVTLPFRLRGAKYYCKKIDEFLASYDYDNSQLAIDGSSMGPLAKSVVLKDVYGEGIQVEFEGHKFFAPSQYDAYLRINYGEYMQLPDEKDRVSNHNYYAYWL